METEATNDESEQIEASTLVCLVVWHDIILRGCSTQQRSSILTPDCPSLAMCADVEDEAEFSTGSGNIILRREIRSSETPKRKKARCLEGGAAMWVWIGAEK